MADKSATAFRTIGEVSSELGVPQHVLRYWETRFPQLRPVTRAGNRRYYRPEDVALAGRIHSLLNRDGYTVKGVQRLLAGKPVDDAAPAIADDSVPPLPVDRAPVTAPAASIDELVAIRTLLAEALVAD